MSNLPAIAGSHWNNFRLHPCGIEVVGEPSFDEWAAAIGDVKKINGAIQWIIGDMLLYGEQRFGEAYSQVLDAADYSDETLRVTRWVASKFEPVTRVTSLSFRHHQEVASLPAEQAASLLVEAEANGLTTRDLRIRVRMAKAAESPQEFSVVEAAERIGRMLEREREKWPEKFADMFAKTVKSQLELMEA